MFTHSAGELVLPIVRQVGVCLLAASTSLLLATAGRMCTGENVNDAADPVQIVSTMLPLP